MVGEIYLRFIFDHRENMLSALKSFTVQGQTQLPTAATCCGQWQWALCVILKMHTIQFDSIRFTKISFFINWNEL